MTRRRTLYRTPRRRDREAALKRWRQPLLRDGERLIATVTEWRHRGGRSQLRRVMVLQDEAARCREAVHLIAEVRQTGGGSWTTETLTKRRFDIISRKDAVQLAEVLTRRYRRSLTP